MLDNDEIDIEDVKEKILIIERFVGKESADVVRKLLNKTLKQEEEIKQYKNNI